MSAGGSNVVAVAEVPNDFRQMRACLFCSLVKTFEQFEATGCTNCEDFLKLKGSRETIEECTSAQFEG
jgi:transcription elongation factor SPT4